MPLELKVQFDIIIYGILSGIIIGALFDVYRLIRGINIPNIIKIIEDILFGIFSAMIVFTFLLYNNYAFLGPYVYLFILITLIIYFKFISKYFVKIEKIIGLFMIKLIRRTSKIIGYPFKLLLAKMEMKNRWVIKNYLNKIPIMFTM